MTMQTMVIAHAAFGHNHFFKNNYLFRQWTDASHIIDYLIFAKNYINDCEEKYGADIVEKVIDSCHAIARHGISRYKRPVKLNIYEETEKKEEREEYLRKIYNDLWRTVPKTKKQETLKLDLAFSDPEENVLYFIEKNSPILKSWQREIVRIIRKINQYFYPQYQTKVMNEGWATFTHFYTMNRLHEKGLITDGAILEFLHMHSGVVYQPDFNSKRYSGFNPYYLGFEMFRDIRRICEEPTEEDKEWFPDFVNTDWLDTCLNAVANYRDESFIRQFLSPTLIRKMKLFTLNNNTSEEHYIVERIHNKEGYKHIRETLASQYEVGNMIPDIQVHDALFKGDRSLILRHNISNGKLLKGANNVLTHIKRLWGYPVKLECREHGSLSKIFSTGSQTQLEIE